MHILLIIISAFFQTNFYSIQFSNIDGEPVSMSQYAGKKILLVNIATNSSRASQLTGLQVLHQQYGDSLVIIGFPSNSFSNETRSNAEIKEFCQANYGVSFLLAAKNPIAGLEIQSVYQWLTTISENGETNEPVKGDYQKYLVDKTGKLVGIFSPNLSPESTEIRNAIEN